MRNLLIAAVLLAAVVLALYLKTSAGAGAARHLNEAVLQNLREAGADLSKPASIDFYVYFPDEPTAQLAATHARRIGDTVTVRPSASDDTMWLCLVTRRLVPDILAIEQIERELIAIATELSGDYDGGKPKSSADYLPEEAVQTYRVRRSSGTARRQRHDPAAVAASPQEQVLEMMGVTDGCAARDLASLVARGERPPERSRNSAAPAPRPQGSQVLQSRQAALAMLKWVIVPCTRTSAPPSLAST